MDEATRALMSLPRCGVKDFPVETSRRKKRFTVQGEKWPYTNLTWSLRTRSFRNTIDYGRIRADLYRALNLWSKHSNLSFREINSDKADILIYFQKGDHGDGFPFDGIGQILAHAFFPGDGRGGDVHFDIEEMWILTGDEEQEEGTNLFAVAAHEFGHSLGLSHSSVRGALMYPWYKRISSDFELPEDDMHGIQQIYGAKSRLWGKVYGDKPIRWPYRPPKKVTPAYIPTTRRTTTTTTTTTTLPPPTSSPTPKVDKPDGCNSSFDALSILRSEFFMFKGKYFWRFDNHGLLPGYPALISRLWNDLPSNFTHIDAVYEKQDRNIIFFIGRNYYIYDGSVLIDVFPLMKLGLPQDLEKIDAALVWGYNSKTYLFSGTVYWRLDDEKGTVELDYPRDIRNVWRGIDYNIDAALQWKDGLTYFFKGKNFWKFNDMRMKVFNDTPLPSGPHWMGCPAVEEPKKKGTPTGDPKLNDPNKSCKSFCDTSVIFLLSLLILSNVPF
ncbi:matrix metalloproteinase-2-like isoform X2 [Cimex lectularius]|nr:matrix metalloproteinase-2-like isoform X2 [Cimex lectularius]